MLRAQLEIRRADPSDADAISGLLRELGHDSPSDKTAQRITRLANSNRDAVFVAVLNERVSGVAHVHMLPLFQADGHIARLTALSVAPDCRRQGVGESLVNAAEECARNGGCERMEITSGDERTAAHEFYRAIGYSPVSQRFVRSLAQGRS